MTTADRARLTALGLLDAVRQNDPDTLGGTLADLYNDPGQHIAVTTTLASLAAGLIDGMHKAGMRDLADQLLQQWINPDHTDDNDDTTP